MSITQRSVWDPDSGLPTSSVLKAFGVKTRPMYVQVRSKQFYRVTSLNSSLSVISPLFSRSWWTSSASQKPTPSMIVPYLGPRGRRTEKERKKSKRVWTQPWNNSLREQGFVFPLLLLLLLPPPQHCLGTGVQANEERNKREDFYSLRALGVPFPAPWVRTRGYVLERTLCSLLSLQLC